MYKIFLVFIMLHDVACYAQVPEQLCKNVGEIARLEATSQGNRMNLQVRTAASPNSDVKYYRCEWEINPAIRALTGKVTSYFVLKTGSSTISYDLRNELIIDSITQRNTKLIFTHTNHLLLINFAGSINPGVVDSLSIYYHGVPPATGFGTFYQATHAGVPIIWTLSEPYGSMDWWPCKNGLDDKADSIDILITTPIAYTAASNGLLQSENVVAGGTKKVAFWKHRYPIASYLVAVAVTNYAVFDNHVQLGTTNLLMRTHCYPENLASWQTNTPNVLDAMKLFHNQIGEYPFIKEKYGHIQFSWGGGMEHQTATFITTTDESLMAHELAHHWFGDKITCASWSDIWLNEGFATHMASFYMENKYPLSVLPTRKSEIDYITQVPGGSVKVVDTNNISRIFEYRYTYLKGSHLVYMLRWKLGDEKFFAGIRSYQSDTALKYRFATTADLKRHLEKESGQNLTEFFNDWYSGEGFPSYKVQWSQFGPTSVKIKINQTTSHPSVSFFEMPVALKFISGSKQKTIVVDNQRNGEEFIRSIGFTADTVIVDPDYWLISRNNTTQKISFTAPAGITVYPVPFQNSFSVLISNIGRPQVKVSVFNTIGQVLYQKNVPLLNGSEYFDIPTINFPPGSYFLKITGGDGFRFTKKLLKH